MQALSLSSWSDPAQGRGSDLGLTLGETHQGIAWEASAESQVLAVGELSMFRLENMQGAGEEGEILASRPAWLFERFCWVSEM